MKRLLVEDDPLINSDLQRLMRYWGYICDLAQDSRSALSMIEADR